MFRPSQRQGDRQDQEQVGERLQEREGRSAEQRSGTGRPGQGAGRRRRLRARRAGDQPPVRGVGRPDWISR